VQPAGARTAAADRRGPGTWLHTGEAALLLGYLWLVVAVITLAPFRFRVPPALRLSWIADPADLLANVLLFAPLGFVAGLPDGATPVARGARLLVGWAAASAALETAQLYLPGRYPSLLDVATNTLGACLGAAVRGGAERRLRSGLPRPLALDLPLVALLYLLAPLFWLDALAAGRQPARLWLLPLLGWFGARILVAVWRHRLRPAGLLSARGLILAALGWFAVCAGPGLLRRPLLLLGSALALAAVVTLEIALPPREPEGERRFELPTLGRAWPLYALYLGLAAFWPWPARLAPWRGSLGLGDIADLPGLLPMLRLVEHLAAFTLGGYMLAEAQGRERQGRRSAAVVLAVALAGAGALEALRGLHPAQSASLLRAGLSAAAALWGAAIYRVQLDLVRRLLAQGRVPGPADARPLPGRPAEASP
jgi:VanZ family protein